MPDDEKIKKRVEELRRRAEESAANADEDNWKGCSNKWQPTAEARKTYHKLAKLIHLIWLSARRKKKDGTI